MVTAAPLAAPAPRRSRALREDEERRLAGGVHVLAHAVGDQLAVLDLWGGAGGGGVRGGQMGKVERVELGRGLQGVKMGGRG